MVLLFAKGSVIFDLSISLDIILNVVILITCFEPTPFLLSIMKTSIVKKIEEFYSLLGGKVTATEYAILAEHGFPTVDYGLPCVTLSAPFVLKCNYDGAGAALATFYGLEKLKPPTNSTSAHLITLKQHSFVPAGKSVTGFADEGYAYIPLGCQDKESVCDIHVAWHGCNQNEGTVRGAFNMHAGYDGYAESNNIIILYPQSERALLKNPQSCFDWWGYTDDDYAFKTGAQMAAVMAMVEHLASGGR